MGTRLEETLPSRCDLVVLRTESLLTDGMFQATGTALDVEGSEPSIPPVPCLVKPTPARAKPIVKRGSKAKKSTSPLKSPPCLQDKDPVRTVQPPRKKRQPRAKKLPDETVHQELVVVDEQSVIPLKDVIGDMEFEDLEPEDLEVVRHLPPPGNIRVVESCSETLSKLRDFERKLQDLLHDDRSKNVDDDPNHDSDATISIISEENDQGHHSAMNPSLDMAVLSAYKYVFDPPVPAVITIPTLVVKLRSAIDWETESKALQYLFGTCGGRAEPSKQSGKLKTRKQTNEERLKWGSKTDDYVKRLITAIEIKSNQPVHLNRPVFSLQDPPMRRKKQLVRLDEIQVDIAPPRSDFAKRNLLVLEKLDLDPLCGHFLKSCVSSFEPAQERGFAKALKRWNVLGNLWKRKSACLDETCVKDLHISLTEARKFAKQLVCGKDRSVIAAHEKYLLDVDEIEKRTFSSTEKAKSHVINMFEENRRQFDLQKTLDFMTCKCDMLAINTRNMRKRAEIQPQYCRLFEDNVGSISAVGNPGSPPHSSQSSIQLPNSQAIKRRKTTFTASVKDSLEDREIFDDLNSIAKVLKDDSEQTKIAPKAAEVVPDNNRLTIDGKVFCRNQEVLVEHDEQGKYSATLLQFTQTEIMFKRSHDGRRIRFPLGLLMDKKLILRNRASSVKPNVVASGK